MSFENPFNSESFEDKAKAEKKSGAPNKASRWLKRAAALAGAVGLGYFAGVREKGLEQSSFVPSSAGGVPVTVSEKTANKKKIHTEVRYVRIADGTEVPQEVEVNEEGEIIKVLEKKSEQKAPTGNFSGYGVTVESKNGNITKSDYGSEEGGKKKFSGYGVETESDEDGVSKSPYGSKSGDGKKFRGYGIEH